MDWSMLIDGESFCASQLRIVPASKLLDARFTTYQPPGDSDSQYSVVGTIWCESTMR
jgi:hypothetical protein